MKKIKNIILFIILLLITGGCNKPELIIFNSKKMKNIKNILINKTTIRSLNYDPFIKQDLQDLVLFELEKSGYQVKVKKIASTNSTQNITESHDVDAVLNMTLIHRKYFKQVEEMENISLNFDFCSSDKNDKKKICSILFSDTDEDYLLNTKYMKNVISEMIKLLKD